jgi:hypothetical protein
MQSVSCTHGGPLEAEQVKHATIGKCYSISEYHRELEIFGEYSFRSCICFWLGEEDSPLCGGYLQLGALVRPEEGKSGVVDMVQ